jgi:signal transduction histidine kinase
MAEKMRETFGQIVLIDADNELVDQIELNKQGIIFYIAEEAINNARKHAQANHTWVRLKDAGQDLLMLEIEDDGVGFSIETINSNYENRGSLGLVNMRERAELVNGLMQIDTAPERGTRIRILIPLSDDAADRLRRGP